MLKNYKVSVLLLFVLTFLNAGALEASPSEAKYQLRKKIIEHAAPFLGSTKPTYYDLAKNLVDNRDLEGHPVRFLSNMQDIASYVIGHSRKDIWAGSYWPTYKGGVSYRYRDPSFPSSEDWSANNNYFWNANVNSSLLSPGEKLEKVFSDHSRRISRAQWDLGKWYFDRSGKVEDWIGICHGWAQAAHMLARPKKVVSFLFQNSLGQFETIDFYPSDIKALASQVWAGFNYSYRFVGSRCDEKNPIRDTNGRIRDPNHPECEDTNSATFHLSLVNQIGLMGRTFLLDSVNSEEVWNYPIKNYQMQFFNVKSNSTGGDWKALLVKRGDYPEDPYKEYRSNDVAYLLGVNVSIRVPSDDEDPSKSAEDSPSNDAHLDFQFSYDLELDANFEVIGGEWRSKDFPDFLWVADRSARIESSGSQYSVEPWDGNSPIPSGWRRGYDIDAANGAILSSFVDLLIRNASRPE